MEMALEEGKPDEGAVVAAECVVLGRNQGPFRTGS
jgi:hypothetical protein